MIPQPATAMHFTLDPATTAETLATIFGVLRRDPERTPAQHQTQRDAGALMIEALHPNNPIEAAYAVRATAAHYASVECFRRTLIPETPDNLGLRWYGKALALSRMATDMAHELALCQAAPPQAQQQPAARPDEGLSEAIAAEMARRAAVARAKAAATSASPAAARPRAGPAAPERRNPPGTPISSERPAFTPAAPAVTAQLAAVLAAELADMPAGPLAHDPVAGPAVSERRNPLSSERAALPQAASAVTALLAAVLAAKLAGMPAGPSAPDPRAGFSVAERRNPLSSERGAFGLAGLAMATGPAAMSCLAPTLPRAGLRASLMSSTSLSGLSSLTSGVVPVPAAPLVMPVMPAGS